MADVLALNDAAPLADAQGDGRALPSHQTRSEHLRERLLATGMRLLANGGFDGVSIAQIAAEAGCSVGAFYQRFRNKPAYFEFLLDRVIEQVRAQTLQVLSPQAIQQLTLPQAVARCVQHHIEVVCEHEGLIRAALGYSMHGSDDWQPISDIGAWLTSHYIGLLLPKWRARRRSPEQDRRQLRAGLQIITGHLINAVIRAPAHLHLRDPELPRWLCQVVLACMHAPPPDATRAAAPG